MTARKTVARALPPRPVRGSPEQTRARLVQAAAEVFNRDGYDGTDSNRIAREAGYSPGTFYKHFQDKKQLFLAVYQEWVVAEWREVTAALSGPGTRGEQAERIVELFLAHHHRWRGLRAGLRALVSVDEEARAFYRAQRRKQLELLASLHAARGAVPRSREQDAVTLFTIERVADALADGEASALSLDAPRLRELLVGLVRAGMPEG